MTPHHRRGLRAQQSPCSAPTRTTGSASASRAGPSRSPAKSRSGRGATVIVECLPLPLKSRAPHVPRRRPKSVTPSIRRTPPEVLSPRVKTLNYLNLIVADHEVHARDPDAWAILLDVNGNICEGLGSNIFVVRDGVLDDALGALRAAGGEPAEGDGLRARSRRGRAGQGSATSTSTTPMRPTRPSSPRPASASARSPRSTACGSEPARPSAR